MTRTEQRPTWIIPPLSDVVFASVMGWLFLAGAGAVALLGDGDTGWHIRTGEYILTTGTFPQQDLFSFSRPGQSWFAWEWLSDVIFALAHKAGGLTGVVLVSGTVIAATSAVLFRFMLWQGGNALVAILLMLIAGSASTIHWLARPHVFTYLLFAVSLWVLEADRRRPTRWVFALGALSVLWTNLHGGFAALVATVGIYLIGSVLETLTGQRPVPQDWSRVKRYGLLLVLVAAGTLVTPYGYHLHQHIFAYLRSDFILNHVMEFQPPTFRGEGMRHFELMLFAGLACVPALLRRKDFTSALLLLAWAHASLTSARHVLLFVVAASPVVARELGKLMEQAAARGGWVKILQDISADYGVGRLGTTRGPAFGWMAPATVAVVCAVLFSSLGKSEKMRAEFSDRLFPVKACTATPDLAGRRIFTSDQWADYLIYRYYPQVKVFLDGRSDFYGAELGEEYLRARNSHFEWEQIFERYSFDLALLPADWPLTTTIKSHPDWKVKYDDGKALLLERVRRPEAENAAARRAGSSPKS